MSLCSLIRLHTNRVLSPRTPKAVPFLSRLLFVDSMSLWRCRMHAITETYRGVDVRGGRVEDHARGQRARVHVFDACPHKLVRLLQTEK